MHTAMYVLEDDASVDAVASVELLLRVQRFVVPVQRNLTDRGLRVPTLTPVHEQAFHAHYFLCFKKRTGFTMVVQVLTSARAILTPHLLTHHIHEYQVDI